MSRTLSAAVAIAVLLFAAAYVGSPFWAARQFQAAALSADVERIDAAIDFPAVRESLKSQMTVALTDRMRNDPDMRANPFAGLGMMVMPVIIDKAVDGFVTPEAMSAMIRRGRMERGAPEPTIDRHVDYDYDYRTLDRFAVAVKASGTERRDAPRFVFERRGLFSWKVIRLELPDSMFAGETV